MIEITGDQFTLFQSMGMDMSQYSVPDAWQNFDTRQTPGLQDLIQRHSFTEQVNPFDVFDDSELDLYSDFGDQGAAAGAAALDNFNIGYQPMIPLIDTTIPNNYLPGPGDIIDKIGEVTGEIVDFFNPFDNGSSSPGGGTATTPGASLGVANMAGAAFVAMPALHKAFSMIGVAVARGQGKVPMSRGMLSKVMTGLGITQIGQALGVDLFPWNNSSEQSQISDMVAEALESGVISDNRAMNYASGTLQPLRAIVITYDRMGEQVERMYAMSNIPQNRRTTARNAVRQSNVVRRRRTPMRRRR